MAGRIPGTGGGFLRLGVALPDEELVRSGCLGFLVRGPQNEACLLRGVALSLWVRLRLVVGEFPEPYDD